MRETRSPRCPDDGTCHHNCALSHEEMIPPQAVACARVRMAGPLSGRYPGDQWPRAVLDRHGVPAPPTLATRLSDEGFRAHERSNIESAVRAWLTSIGATSALAELDRS